MADPTMRELAFIGLLDEMSYERAVAQLGSGTEALRTAFNCTLNGWVSRGVLTPEGRAFIRKPIKTTAWDIKVLPSGPNGSNGSEP